MTRYLQPLPNILEAGSSGLILKTVGMELLINSQLMMLTDLFLKFWRVKQPCSIENL